MRRLALVIVLAAAPAAAQAPAPEEDAPELLSRGVETLLRELLGDVGPALRELREGLRGLDAYHPPEILPNGDIIIRRKAPLGPPDGAGEGDEVEI